MIDFLTIFGAAVAAITLAGGAYAFGRSNGYRQAMLDLNNERESKRFTEVYAPLMGLFTTCHITTVSTRGAPYIRQRVRNTVTVLSKGNLYRFFLALFDKQDLGASGEVEYGESFPLVRITKHLQGREQFTDQKLISLVAQANRAQYEDRPEENALTKADLDLFSHVCHQHEVLSSRFVGA